MVQQINTKYNNYAFTYYYISLYWLQISKMGDFGPYNDMYFNPATFYYAYTNPGSEWLCISVLGVSILPVSTFFDQILELSQQCDIFFTLYLKSKNLYSNLWTYWNTIFVLWGDVIRLTKCVLKTWHIYMHGKHGLCFDFWWYYLFSFYLFSHWS